MSESLSDFIRSHCCLYAHFDRTMAAELHVDGVLRGWMTGYRHQVTWDVEALTIGLGQRFRGKIDEVLILDKALRKAQVEEMHGLSSAVGALIA